MKRILNWIRYHILFNYMNREPWDLGKLLPAAQIAGGCTTSHSIFWKWEPNIRGWEVAHYCGGLRSLWEWGRIYPNERPEEALKLFLRSCHREWY